MLLGLSDQEKNNVHGARCKCNTSGGMVDNSAQTPYGCRIYCCELVSNYMQSFGWIWVDDATGLITTDGCGIKMKETMLSSFHASNSYGLY